MRTFMPQGEKLNKKGPQGKERKEKQAKAYPAR